jgi:cytoskeletal protein RodZ
MFDKLAEELKKARESLQLSPEQVASKIRMDLKFLLQMEKGNFSFLPDVYLKAFIKEYAKVVGLDDLLILKKYELAKEGKSIDQTETIDLSVPPDITTPPKNNQIIEKAIVNGYSIDDGQTSKKINKNQSYIIVGAILIFFSLLVYYFFVIENSEEIITEIPYDELVSENKQRFIEETNIDSSENTTTIPSDSLTLHFIANDSSWLKVTFDGTNTKEFYLYKNKSLEVKALNSFNLLIGNANALTVKLNNEPIKINQKGKRVTRALVDKSGVKYIESSTSNSNNARTKRN